MPPQYYAFETVDVFTRVRFGGNQLAVFTDARGLSDDDMQSLASEFNLSETTFVLPASDPANDARVRIFNRTAEMPFAGHPSVGTACVIARKAGTAPNILRLEVPAGIVIVELERDAEGGVVGGKVTAPQPLAIGDEFSVETVAACAGLDHADIVVTAHRPIMASTGNPYIIAQVTENALSRCATDIRAFRRAVEGRPDLNGRFSLLLYARQNNDLHVRMFAPLAGTFEDPATGSANAPLGALLLSLERAQFAEFNVRQGAEMGRPSFMHVTATRRGDDIIATVAGGCVPVFRGEAMLE